MPSQLILQQKSNEVEEIKKILQTYKTRSIGIADLKKVRATQLQELKKTLANKVDMRVIKNTLLKIAIDNLDEENLNKLKPLLEGSNILLFTDLNPFKLSIILEKGKVKTIAKTGDKAAMDIVIPEGNTGQPPGPIISVLNAAGLPTRIQSGSVWVAKDTFVAKKGDVINERLAVVLAKLGIKAVEAGLIMKAVYDDGLIVNEEQLVIDLDATQKALQQSQQDAFALALGVAYPTKETIEPLLQIAHKNAYALSMAAEIPTKENIADLIRKAHAQMQSLSNTIEKTKK